MINNKYFVINFITRKESKMVKVPYKFEEATFILDEFINSINKPNCDYWINHTIVYHKDQFIHQFDIFENSKSNELDNLIDYKEFKNEKNNIK